MILGIGTDILDIKRFQRALTKSLITRVFTPKEQACAQKLKGTGKINYLAKRFAGKEAVSKAIGTGIGAHIGWQDIEILNHPQGAPTVSFSPAGKKFIRQKFKCQKIKAHISLSDDKEAIAFVVLEK